MRPLLAWRRRALLAALLSLCAVPVPAQQNPCASAARWR